MKGLKRKNICKKSRRVEKYWWNELLMRYKQFT